MPRFSINYTPPGIASQTEYLSSIVTWHRIIGWSLCSGACGISTSGYLEKSRRFRAGGVYAWQAKRYIRVQCNIRKHTHQAPPGRSTTNGEICRPIHHKLPQLLNQTLSPGDSLKCSAIRLMSSMRARQSTFLERALAVDMPVPSMVARLRR